MNSSTLGPSLATAAWLWSRAAGRFVPVTPARFDLHEIAETDRRFHALARGERIEVAAPAFLLWAPAYLSRMVTRWSALQG